MKIIFVRHGEINLKTGTLTRTGVKQIKMAGKYLSNENIDFIFCSPKTRTIQSANILNTFFKSEMIIENGFNERQILTPIKRDQFGDEFDENYLNYNYQSQNFETCKDFIDRILQGMVNVINKIEPKVFKKVEDPLELLKKGTLNLDGQIKMPDETIVIVAHSSTLYGINAFINGIPKNGQINWLQCNNGAVVKYFI